MPLTRDHKYMTQVLDRILMAWMHAPELRLGQLLTNAIDRHTTVPTFYIEDDHLAGVITEFDDQVLSVR